MFPTLNARSLLLVGAWLSLAATSPSTANDLFEPPVFYPAGDLPFDVTAGDLNGDSAPDLVVANVLSEDITIRLNDGAGNFPSEVHHAIGARPRAVAVGDLNGDGHRDIAVGRQQANPTLAILLNDGEGEFASPVVVGNFAGFPDELHILHFDDDDHADIVIGNPSSGSIVIFRGASNGTFVEQAFPTGTGPAYPSDMATGDLDGDGDVDCAVSASLSANPPRFLLSDGEGALGSPSTSQTRSSRS